MTEDSSYYIILFTKIYALRNHTEIIMTTKEKVPFNPIGLRYYSNKTKSIVKYDLTNKLGYDGSSGMFIAEPIYISEVIGKNTKYEENSIHASSIDENFISIEKELGWALSFKADGITEIGEHVFLAFLKRYINNGDERDIETDNSEK